MNRTRIVRSGVDAGRTSSRDGRCVEGRSGRPDPRRPWTERRESRAAGSAQEDLPLRGADDGGKVITFHRCVAGAALRSCAQ